MKWTPEMTEQLRKHFHNDPEILWEIEKCLEAGVLVKAMEQSEETRLQLNLIDAIRKLKEKRSEE